MAEKTSQDQDEVALGRRIDALLDDAEFGGALALQAARQAAALAADSDPVRFRRALALAANLDPLNAAPRLALARRLGEEGDLDGACDEAAIVLKEAVDQSARSEASVMLGEIARVRGELAAAREHFETAATIDDLLLRTNPADRNATQHFARVRGRIAELDAADGATVIARTGAEAALKMLHALAIQSREDALLGADIADAELRLGAFELDSGAPGPAREHLAEAIKRYEALTLHEPDEPHWRAVLADAWTLAAEAAFALGARDPARHAIDKAMALRTKLAAKDPTERWALAGLWRQRATLMMLIDDHRGASLSLEQARLLVEQLCAESESEAIARFHVHTLLEIADHALTCGDLSAARDAAETARHRAEPYAQPRDAVAWRADLAAAWERLGDIARAAKAPARAQEAFARAIELRRLAREQQPHAPGLARGLASALLKAGDGELEAGAIASARTAYSESVALRLALSEAEPELTAYTHALAVALERMGVAALAAGDTRAARSAWREELALAHRLYSNPHDTEGLRFCAIVESHLAELGGLEAEAYRAEAIRKFDALAQHTTLSAREEHLRERLWRGSR